MDILLGLSLLLAVLLGGAVVNLYANQRHFQRVDYEQLIAAEERENQQLKRLQHFERLLADMMAHRKRERREIERMLQRTRVDLAAEIACAREEIITEVMRDPATIDNLLLERINMQAVRSPSTAAIGTSASTTSRANGCSPSPLVTFPHGERQSRITDLLEEGMSPHDAAVALGLSQHEVELVSAMIFKSRSA